jgi:hypothetical protein
LVELNLKTSPQIVRNFKDAGWQEDDRASVLSFCKRDSSDTTYSAWVEYEHSTGHWIGRGRMEALRQACALLDAEGYE